MYSSSSRSVVERILEPAGVHIGSEHPFDLDVHDERFYERLLKGGSLAFGESYVDGWWDCEQLDELVRRIFTSGAHESVPDHLTTRLQVLRARLFNLQSVRRAFQVGEHHYDIGNDLYVRMLGETMSYTCAYWRHAGDLDSAQRAKFDLVCRKVGLREGMHILELGCGWATFARHAAATHGVRATAYTVSKEQAALGRELCAGLPVDIRLADYRSASGQYDAVVSIGIMEHIGHKNYRTYMNTAHRCLKPGGVAFVHTIGGNRSRMHIEPWLGKYIFPNAMLPSMSQLGAAMERLFVLEDVHNIGPDYDPTLMAWWRNFEAAWPEFAPRYGERFRRMWRYYLLGCAGSFRARYTQLWQMVMTRTRDGRPQPACRVV
jgi:cyclopropane-fatty-acyl-phospholipid synthase